MSANPIAARVARRHQAAVQRREQTLPDFTRRISDDDLSRLLEPTIGRLLRVRFRAAMDDGFGVVAWEAVTVRGDYITGKLFLRTVVREDEVVSWAEVTVDQTR